MPDRVDWAKARAAANTFAGSNGSSPTPVNAAGDQGLLSKATPPVVRRSIADVLGRRVEKGYLQDLDTGRFARFLFNPEVLKEKYGARYARMDSPGLSHQRLHYVGTNNVTFPLKVVLDQLVYDRQRGSQGPQAGDGSTRPNDVETWRRFVISHCYPRRSQKLSAASPAPVLFNWPHTVSMKVRIIDVDIETILFEVGTARPRIMHLDIQLEEDARERTYNTDIERLGTIRTNASATTPKRGR